MNVKELNEEQLQFLKINLYDEILTENENRGVSINEMINIDNFVTNEQVFERFNDYSFVEEDFDIIDDESDELICEDTTMNMGKYTIFADCNVIQELNKCNKNIDWDIIVNSFDPTWIDNNGVSYMVYKIDDYIMLCKCE